MSDWVSTLLLFASVGFLAYFRNRNLKMEGKHSVSVPVQVPVSDSVLERTYPVPVPNELSELSDKTKAAIQEAIAKNDEKTKKWIEVSIAKGYEGVGVIPYIFDPTKKIFYFAFGINKKGEAEYPGGKVDLIDSDKEDTVRREVLEETGLDIAKERFTTGFEVTGGTTGYPSYVYVVEITDSEFKQMKSEDNTFSKFILVQNIFADEMKDENSGEVYKLRNFNKKYVLPQVKERLLDYIEAAMQKKLARA